MARELETQISPEARQSEIDKVLPPEQAEYYAALHDKHFDTEKAVGSLFTDAKDLKELLGQAIEQRGSLSGDDREKFTALGVPPEAMMPNCRYLKVETKGEVGIVKVSDLSPETPVRVIRTKPKVPCSLVVEGTEFPQVDFGTIIIGPNAKGRADDPEPSTSEMVWTVHPGLPIRPATEDYWPEGSEITVKEVIERLGDRAYLNVQKKK